MRNCRDQGIHDWPPRCQRLRRNPSRSAGDRGLAKNVGALRRDGAKGRARQRFLQTSERRRRRIRLAGCDLIYSAHAVEPWGPRLIEADTVEKLRNRIAAKIRPIDILSENRCSMPPQCGYGGRLLLQRHQIFFRFSSPRPCKFWLVAKSRLFRRYRRKAEIQPTTLLKFRLEEQCTRSAPAFAFIQEKSSTESFRRALIVAGSTAPQASKNCSNCLRAPSSFQARSCLMISMSSAAAASRRPSALRRMAKSNRA